MDPGAWSATAAEVSFTAGTGDYTLGGAIPAYFRFADIPGIVSGATVRYSASDTSGQTELGLGIWLSPETLSRDTIFRSTNGNAAVNWPANGQVIVRALNVGIPLCAAVPLNGQVLIWSDAEQAWCPGDISGSGSGGPDDDAADMQNVDSGTVYGVTITKFDTQVIWNSTDPGDKTTTIPATSDDNDGFSLDIKLATGDGSNHCIEVPSGTIGGIAGGIQVQDENCNLSLRSNHTKNDWLIRQFSCFEPEPCTPVVVPVVPDCDQGIRIQPNPFQSMIVARATAIGGMPTGLVPDSSEFTLSFWYIINELPTGYQIPIPTGSSVTFLPPQFVVFDTNLVDDPFSGHGVTVGIANISGGAGVSFLLHGRDFNHFFGLFVQSGDFQTVGVWHHVALSFNSTTGIPVIYVDDAAVPFTTTFAYIPVLAWTGYSALTMNWSDIADINVAIMEPAGPGDSFTTSGFTSRTTPIDFKHVWFKADVGLDLTNTAVRRKLIDNTGQPVGLGTNGEIPTGTPATVYLCGWPIITTGQLGPYFLNVPSANSIDVAPTPTQPKVGQP